ncbi:hypothetical protein ADIARSV_2674 [Arcticibacter svalbardensis MN12-7]|uniref:Lipoprotein n=1 Tax=Arcticibacter svalbardensis MN12-7 TaxID=1150600 RepID=R9GZ04_9SPHI|nr:hypothetical protein [Arcticibacter svalbardensis]EOR94179.1 hypothetical protein ADIARSV_2674 [Arcticibacter svalbardensis MN12-7]
MKKSNLYYVLMALPLLISCNQNPKQTDSTSATVKDSMISRQCYVAVDGKDTAFLDIKELSSGKIDGSLVINFTKSPKNEGIVQGKYSGDTLFVDYSYAVGTNKANKFKNPLAFLKKDNQLILGVGAIETSLGKSYFVKGIPIDFDKGRFKFNLGECKKE